MSETRIVPELSATSDLPVVQPEPVIAPTPEPAVAPTPVPTPAVAPAPEHRPIERRFGELAAQRREAEARAERLEKIVSEQSEQLKQALAALRPTTPASAVPAAGPVRPSRDSFADSESYETALVSWAGEQAAATAAADLRRVQEENDRIRAEKAAEEEAARARAERESEQARLEREFHAGFQARIAKKKEAAPEFDFDKIVQAPLAITTPMARVIMLQEADGLDVADYLYKNPTEASRIANISTPGQVFPAGHQWAGLPVPDDVAQAFELGKIAARLGSTATIAPASAETIETTPAPAQTGPVVVAPAPTILPAPPEPISGASAAATRRDPADMSMEEYAATRMPQLRAERRPGRAVH